MDILNRVIKHILGSNPELKRGVDEARILSFWASAVGEQIAKHARAVQIKGKTLFVAVEHPIWKQELHSNKRLAITRFNEKLVAEMGPPPGEDAIWIDDLFIVSPSTTTPKFPKKR